MIEAVYNRRPLFFKYTMKRKRQVLSLLLLFLSISLSGQNMQKYYVSKNVESGMLYFINPMELFQSCKNTCTFDQTIRPHNDTISIGITFTNKQVFKVDSIAIINKDTIIGKKVDHLFTEQTHNKWACRFFIYLTRKELKKLYSEQPPVVSFWGMEKSNTLLQVKPKNWKKIVEINGAIYNQIKLNEQ